MPTHSHTANRPAGMPSSPCEFRITPCYVRAKITPYTTPSYMSLIFTILLIYMLSRILQPLRMASTSASIIHYKARTDEYQGGVKRFPVPDDKVFWNVSWSEYSPVDYTAPPVLKNPVWADPDIRLFYDVS